MDYWYMQQAGWIYHTGIVLKAAAKDYILYDFIYMTFSKRLNESEGEQFTVPKS